jgi:hypothetical protein
MKLLIERRFKILLVKNGMPPGRAGFEVMAEEAMKPGMAMFAASGSDVSLLWVKMFW